MDTNRDLNPQEEKMIFKAIEEFREYGKTDIKCPICKGGLNYIGNNSSFAIECENCGIIYSLRGI